MKRNKVLCCASLVLAALVVVSMLVPAAVVAQQPVASQFGAGRVISAAVVAIDQPIVYNRLGAVTPGGMMYALRHDVLDKNSGLTEAEGGVLTPGQVALRADKRPRPLTLRMNVGDQLQIHFQNLLAPEPLLGPPPPPDPTHPGPVGPGLLQPATRSVGIHVLGLHVVNSILDDGSNVGQNESSLVAPDGSITYTLHADHEGTYLLQNTADSGSGVLSSWNFGLFGAVNVEPAGSEWYRSQVTQADLALATTGSAGSGHPIINYDAVYPAGHRYAGLPILKMLNGSEIVHSDLNAIITGAGRGPFPNGLNPPNPAYPNRNQPFREFTQIFHDENEILQAFPIFENPAYLETLHSVRDSFAINYGADGAGPEVVANRLGVGPMWASVDAKYEEFFLTSWVVGDPAMIVDIPANTTDAAGQLVTGPKATKALYPDDPSNVYHSYMNDRVKIRNVAVGKEPHIYHLHTHQWLLTPDDDNSNYLDMQMIAAGSGFTYEITYNGSGNRNKTFGDAIFHCHFYPHFAQGMWGLWRVHDVFEGGTVLDAEGRPAPGSRALPDGEITAGTPIPAIVPLPGLSTAPIPGDVTIVPGSTFTPELPGGQISITEPDANGDGKPDRNVGFPLFIPGVAGHRPPTPPMDLVDDGGLPRHIIIGGAATKVIDPLSFAADFTALTAKFLPEDGTPAEKAAMDFHALRWHDTPKPDGTPATGAGRFRTNGLPPVAGAPFADPAATDDGAAIPANREYRAAVIQLDAILNKAGWHFPQSRIETLWGDVEDTLSGAKPPEPFVMRGNSGDVIDFYHTNLVPMRYQQDAFQVLTETDVIGQHMHLVKFDVLSADGSANGYNYEDGTFSPEEVRERIDAIKQPGGEAVDLPEGMTIDDLEAQPHPFFGAGPNDEWLGARTTIQRWYVDPLVNNAGQERIMGNSFTHDHFGPSTVQQAGLYGSLLTEPNGSQWRDSETGHVHGGEGVTPRSIGPGLTDGGPTGWRVDVLTQNPADSYREFYFEFADFQLAYAEGRGGTTANPIPDREGAIAPPLVPEAVSAADVGTYSVNYRNEPLGYRVFDPATGLQALGQAGDLSLAMSSNITRADPRFNQQPAFYPPLTADVGPGDPFTPMPRAYVNDKVKVRIQVGATEEGHNFSIHGLKWLQEYASQNSGWRNSQMMGISEQFILDTVIPPEPQQTDVADYLYSANSASEGFWNGMWGVLRSYARPRNDLLPLPNNPIGANGLTIANSGVFNGLAPSNAPMRQFDVTAVAAQDALPGGTLVYNSRTNGSFGPLHDPTAILFVRTEDLDVNGKLKPGVPVEPLVLRAAAGERIVVTLRNRLPAVLPNPPGANIMPLLIPGFNTANITPSNRIGLHPQLVAYSMGDSDGSNVGMNTDQTIGPGETIEYQWYAGDVRLVNGNLVATPIEFGAINLSSSDKVMHSNKGAIGALVIEPQGSTWIEDTDGRTSATVTLSGGAAFRDFVVVIQDDVNLKSGDMVLPNVGGEDDAEDSGQKAVNYRAEPFWFRLGIAPTTPDGVVIANDFTDSLSNSIVGGDPQTPVFIAGAGTPIRLRVLKPGGHNRNEAFALNGHVWQRDPYTNDSTEIGENPVSPWIGAQAGIGPTGHFDIVPAGGAGGGSAVLGDYLFRDMSPTHFNNGAWGILRVVRDINLLGLNGSAGLSLNQHGNVVKPVELASQDGGVALTLQGGVTLSGSDGPVVSLSGGDVPPPAPANGASIRTFQIGPPGVSFDPAMTLAFAYDPSTLPANTRAATLGLVAWNGNTWQDLPSELDAAAHVVSAQINSSGAFALVGRTLTAPAAPVEVTATTATHAQVVLGWTPGDALADGFHVERFTGNEDFTRIGSAGAGAATFTDNNVQALTRYNYRVVAFNSAGDSTDTSAVVVVTTQVSPDGVLPPPPSGGGGSAPPPAGGGAIVVQPPPVIVQPTPVPQPTLVPEPVSTPAPTPAPTVTPPVATPAPIAMPSTPVSSKEVEVQAEVETEIEVEHATAVDDNGVDIKPTAGVVKVLTAEDGKITITLPVPLPVGSGLRSFEDSGSGTKLSGDTLTRLMKDATGNVVGEIEAKIEKVEGTGTEARISVKSLKMRTREQEQDLSGADVSVGKVSARVEVELKDLPPGASLNVTMDKEGTAEARGAIAAAAAAAGQTVKDVAYVMDVKKTNLENVTDVGTASVEMKVSSAWVVAQGEDNVRIIRIAEDGQKQVLPTTVVSVNGGQHTFRGVSSGGLSVFGLVALQPVPTPTPTPAPTATPMPTSTPAPTATPQPTATVTPAPTATLVPQPSATPQPTATPVPPPTETPAPTTEPTPANQPAETNWGLIVGLIAAVAIVMVGGLVWRRRTTS